MRACSNGDSFRKIRSKLRIVDEESETSGDSSDASMSLDVVGDGYDSTAVQYEPFGGRLKETDASTARTKPTSNDRSLFDKAAEAAKVC